jgi:hypothetical protein
MTEDRLKQIGFIPDDDSTTQGTVSSGFSDERLKQIGFIPDEQPFVQQTVSARKPRTTLEAILQGISHPAPSAIMPQGARAFPEQLIQSAIVNPSNLIMKVLGSKSRLPPVDFDAGQGLVAEQAGEAGSLGGVSVLGLMGAPIARAATELPFAGALGKALPAFLKRAGGVLKRPVGSGALFATQQPEHPIKAAAVGAALSPLMDIAAGGAGIAKDLLAHPVQTGKSLAKLAVSKIPGMAAGARRAIGIRLNDLLATLKGSSSAETAKRDIFNSVNIQHEMAKEQTNRLNDAFSDRASELNKKFIPKIFHDKVNEWENIIKNESKIFQKKEPSKILKPPFYEEEKGTPGAPDLLKTSNLILRRLKNYKNTNLEDFSGEKTLRYAMNADLRNPAFLNIAPRLKQIIPDLQQSLTKATDVSAEGDPELMKLRNAFNQHFKTNQLPFEKEWNEKTRNLTKPTMFFKQKNNPDPKLGDFISHYVKPGIQKDQAEKLQQLLNWLPDRKAKNLVAYDYLSAGENHPATLMNQYKKLGNKQKQLLFPDHYKELNELENLYKKKSFIFSEKGGTGQGFFFGRLMAGSLLGALRGHIAEAAGGGLLAASPEILELAMSPAFERSEALRKLLIESAQPKEAISAAARQTIPFKPRQAIAATIASKKEEK